MKTYNTCEQGLTLSLHPLGEPAPFFCKLIDAKLYTNVYQRMIFETFSECIVKTYQYLRLERVVLIKMSYEHKKVSNMMMILRS